MKYIAFLRGISPMNAPSTVLRTVFERLSFNDVQTVISSGNVIFSSPEKDTAALEACIEEALKAQINLKSSAIIRSAPQIQALIRSRPFGTHSHSQKTYLTVTFIKRQPMTTDFGQYLHYDPTTWAICDLHEVSAEKTPDFMARLEKVFGKDVTTRTWNTVLKIGKKLD